MSVKQLKETLAKHVEAARAIISEAEKAGRDLSVDDRAKIEKINADARVVMENIATQNELDRIAAESAKALTTVEDMSRPVGQPNAAAGPTITDEDSRLAISAWALNQPRTADRITPQHMEAASKVGININTTEIVLRLPCGQFEPNYRRVRGGGQNDYLTQYVNTLGTAPDDKGGYFIPRSMAATLDQALLDYSGVLQAATILNTSTGEQFDYPTANDTSNTASLVGENTLISTTSVDPSIASITLRSYNYQSGFVRVSNTVLRDSAFDLGTLLGGMLGERHGRRLNTDCTTGTGASRPKGIVTASILGVTAASATAVTFAEAVRLIHSVDPAYRPGAAFMMSDLTFLEFALLTATGSGEFLLSPDPTAPHGYRLRGYPIFINQAMTGVPAASTIVVLFGALSKYIVRRVGAIRLVRAAERFLEYDQTAFIAFMSYDGNLIDAGTNPVKHMIMHS